MIGIFCKRALLKRRYSAKETYDFKEPNPHILSVVKVYHKTDHNTDLATHGREQT